MSAVGSHLRSHVSKSTRLGWPWYVYTPQGEHAWAQTWHDAMNIANHCAREAQREALR